MANYNSFLIFLILTIFFISLSAVSAVDINETDDDIQSISSSPEENGIIGTDSNCELYSSASSEYNSKDFHCKFEQTGNYYNETELHLKLTNTTSNRGIADTHVSILVDGSPMGEYVSDSNGVIKTEFKKMPGQYQLEAKLKDSTKTIGTLHVTVSGIPTKINLAKTGAYYKNTKIKLTLTDLNNKALSGEDLQLKFSNGETATITTNSKGIATYNMPFKPGTYSVTASTVSKYIKKNKATLNNFKIKKTYLKISPNSISTTYGSGKTLNIKVTSYSTNQIMKNIKISLKVYTGKKSKTVTVKTNDKGIAKYDASQLNAGVHKIEINNAEPYMENGKITTAVKVTKAKLTISAPKITADKNSAKNLKITVKNKETKKAIKNVNVNVKVYTGKNFKTYNLKTNKNGQVSISSGSLTKANHNVIISVKSNSNINAATAKTTISIK